jgi:hypothetical protein
MAIASISSVNFRNNYNQVNFEGKRKEEHRNTGNSSIKNTLKSIPLATLIAMSPMTSPAQEAKEEKIIASTEFKHAFDEDDPHEKCIVQFVSTDGNDDDAEKVYIVRCGDTYIPAMVNGRYTKYKSYFSNRMEINAIKCVNVTRTYAESPDVVSQLYYVEGPCHYTSIGYDTPQGRVPGKDKKNPNGTFQISQRFYNSLNDLLEDMIEHKTASEIIDGDAETANAIYDYY